MEFRFWRIGREPSPPSRGRTEATEGQVTSQQEEAGHPRRDRDSGLVQRANAEARWDASRARPGDRKRYWLYGVRPEPLASFRGTVEEPASGKVGICCSGGGIRSAAYNLGALQALTQENEFKTASYLAAVSGGSYIAAAFSMVAKTWDRDQPRPDDPDEPGFDDSNPRLFARCPPFARGSPEEQYLRNRSSYLAPDGMGKLFLAFRILLGLLFNLFFVSLPLFGAALLLGELLYRPVFSELVGHCQGPPDHCVAQFPLWWWLIPVVVAGISLIAGLVVMILRLRSDRRTQFFEVWSTRLLVGAAGAGLVLVALPALVDLFHGSPAAESNGTPETGTGITAAAVGIAGLVAGLVSQLREAMASPKQAGEALTSVQKAFRGLSKKARLALAYLAGAIIGPLFLIAAVVFALSIALAASDSGAGWWNGMNWWVVGGGTAALALTVALYLIADITTWSLHPVYKRRLCTAFALKRVRASDLTSSERDRAQVPSDSDAGVALERDFDKLVDLSATAPAGDDWPTLLVCAAANVSDPGATPPGRHVTSFTFSPYSIGGPLVGGAPTDAFETAFSGRDESSANGLDDGSESVDELSEGKLRRMRRMRRDFSLPAAVAVSGAAISPSMGKMTRRPLTFLMTLANLRLGVWVPNPRWVQGGGADDRKWHRRPRPIYLLRELLGRNRVDGHYLYVTDGGHYENLGLVELLRRGCTEIYCFDASGGEGFEVLGDAVALARSELGVDIKIDPEGLFPDKETDEAKTDVVKAEFKYRDVQTGEARATGTLIYARNVLTDDVPWDVKARHKTDPRFPHNSTADQLYTDQKFESYRALGEEAGRDAVRLMKVARQATSVP